jgi:phosphoribosylformylglycinamidine (FGAM) synthase PurS component
MSYRLHLGNSSPTNTASSSNIIIGNSSINIGDSNSASSIHSVWDTITSKGVTLQETLDALSGEINTLRVENKIMKLKLLALEGKFTQEEVTNICKMIMSEDEAAKTLADSIIENA